MKPKKEVLGKPLKLVLLIVALLLVPLTLAACGEPTATPAGPVSSSTVAGVTQTAGSVTSGAMTPATTPTMLPTSTPVAVTTTQVATTSQPTNNNLGADLPVFIGATSINLTDSQQEILSALRPVITTIVENPQFQLYRLINIQDSSRVSDFYKLELTKDGWINLNEQIGQFTQQTNLTLLGSNLSFYTKDNQIVMVGVSAPLTTETINAANLGELFQKGDIAVLTIKGISKINVK